MNATKRKFNSIVQGIDGKSPVDVTLERPSENTVPDTNEPSATMQRPAVLPTTPTKTTTSVPDTGAHSSTPVSAATPTTGNTTLMPSSANILSKRRRVTEVLTSTLGPSKTTTAPSRFANNAILKKYGSNPVIATIGKIEKPTPASRYCPGDRDELIRRLGTFQELTEWTPKPDRINEIEWAKRGWLCQGRERVRCALCNKELVVKLNSDKKPDNDSTTSFGGSQVEEAMVTRFSELIVDAHQEECLWRKRGCDESLLRLHITSPQTTLESLRQRYDDLASRPAFLPYMFNLRLPPSLDVQAAKAHLPASFFTDPAPPSSLASTMKEGSNDVALVLALTGWQGLTNPRIGPVPNSASCATCLRKLGLWLFKSQEVDEASGQVIVAAPMDHLDPVREHRFFCPWRNPDAQRNAGSKSTESKAAWEVLLQTLKNNAYLKSQAERSNQKASNWTPRRAGTILHRATASVPSTPLRASAATATTPLAETPTDQSHLTMLGPGMGDNDDYDDDPAARDAKDKERWARLRRVKTLFDTKGAKKLRRALSRPGTAGSHGSGGQSPRPVTAGAAQPMTSTPGAAEAT